MTSRKCGLIGKWYASQGSSKCIGLVKEQVGPSHLLCRQEEPDDKPYNIVHRMDSFNGIVFYDSREEALAMLGGQRVN